MRTKILSLLVLLLTAASGAWADEPKVYDSGEVELFSLELGDIILPGVTLTNKGDNLVDAYLNGNRYSIEGEIRTMGNRISSIPFSIGVNGLITAQLAGDETYNCMPITEDGKAGNAWVVMYIDEDDYWPGYKGINIGGITYGDAPNAVEVTTNAASEGATFTEASFAMPAFDATATYELVRDITQKVDVEVRIDGTATERVRIAKDGDGHYKFVTKQENGWQFAAVDKLDNNKDLTDGELTYSFKMKEGNDYVAKNFDTDLCPGTWRLEATANDGKPYEGIAYSKDIVLYDGYEITVAAGEYATFYKDEALYTEDADAELYTIASVTDTEVVLSEAIKVAPAETPLLVYNKGEQDKTFLLLPTEEQADAITAADQFKGTLVAKKMPASTEGEDYYVCTGKAFVWVMNEGTIAANKCWLEIIAQAAGARANTRSITGGSDTTGIDAATRDDIDGNYYDLQGRKVVKPNSKGIYIKNGKKVIKH